MLVRILITAVMLIATEIYPASPASRSWLAYVAAYLVIGYDILTQGRKGHSQRTRV